MPEIFQLFDSFMAKVHPKATKEEREALLSSFTAGVVAATIGVQLAKDPRSVAEGLYNEMREFAHTKAEAETLRN